MGVGVGVGMCAFACVRARACACARVWASASACAQCAHSCADVCVHACSEELAPRTVRDEIKLFELSSRSACLPPQIEAASACYTALRTRAAKEKLAFVPEFVPRFEFV
eukprot:1828235-Pleurochrysis_carterae.AAC.1